MSKTIVLVTGAGGYLGGLLAQTLPTSPHFPSSSLHLILTDVLPPKTPSPSLISPERVLSIRADLSDKSEVEGLFSTPFGVPDVVFCLHGIMSRGAEDNFDLGMRVNLDAVRAVLDAARHHGAAIGRLIKFVFTSSIAVYGGPLPDVVTPSTIATPVNAYGTEKLCSELLVNEYSRRGFVDGRIVRLPTITVRPGPPAAATTAFISGIIREPLKGVEAVCPIGPSLDSPDLNLPVWIASPQTTILNIIHASTVPASKFFSHSRVVCLPGFTVTIKDELDALAQVGGKDKLKLIKFEADETNKRVVESFPARFDNSYSMSLGFMVDKGGMVSLVESFKRDVEAGLA